MNKADWNEWRSGGDYNITISQYHIILLLLYCHVIIQDWCDNRKTWEEERQEGFMEGKVTSVVFPINPTWLRNPVRRGEKKAGKDQKPTSGFSRGPILKRQAGEEDKWGKTIYCICTYIPGRRGRPGTPHSPATLANTHPRGPVDARRPPVLELVLHLAVQHATL